MTHRLSLWAFAAMLALVCAPLLLQPTWEARMAVTTDGTATRFQILGLVMFMALSALSLPRSFAFLRGSPDITLALAFLWFCVLTSILGIETVDSAIYAILLGVYGMFMMGQASRPDFTILLRHAHRAVLLIMIIILVSMPYNGQTFGGIQPNTFSKVALAVFALSFAETNPRLAAVARILAIVVIALVTSRSAALTTLFMLLTIGLVKFSRGHSIGLVYGSAATAVLAMLGALGLWFSTDPDAINAILGLKDENIASRFRAWGLALVELRDSPIWGYGLQSREAFQENLDLYRRSEGINAHNGYLNMALDVGLVGTAIFLVLWLRAIARNMAVLRTLDPRDSRARALLTVTIVLSSSLFTWISEPLTVNFGNPWSILLTMSLFASAALRRQVRPERKVARQASRTMARAPG